ncbi:hypothetical protein G6O67_008490 [Ophiocordyceps sinensis]|uniref:DUF3835 domain-containing protein n=1 Tax=Ophiocordyceps sinensis TaxID=72228 RepID=A0A8H4LS15_9HYPO|nr:hypothetical protein G6O67_008490 [Ophiocordyceps sinensis]
MAGVKDSFPDLEWRRLQLEDNIKQLRKALQHWQTWDAEYEALKEEVDAAPDSADDEAQELHRIHGDYEGELLRGKELDDVFGPQGSRSREQVINILQRRIDYVTKNVESLQKQLEAVENEHAAATVVSQPDATDENGEPFTEIIENLDHDDNVVSFRLNRPGDSGTHVLDALAKAGIDEVPEGQSDPKQQAVGPLSGNSISLPARPISDYANGTKQTRPVSPPPTPKKAVSFVEDADSGSTNTPALPTDMSRQARRLERVMQTARDQEMISLRDAVIPEDEEPEDAALRRQMLEYCMGEIGSVVAELQLEEGDTDDGEAFDYGHDRIDQVSDEDNKDDDGEAFDYGHDCVDQVSDEDDEDDDGEDRFGRSTSRMVTDDYRQRMLELERKLGIKSRLTQDADDEHEDSGADDEGIGRIVVKHGQESPSSASKPSPMKSGIKDGQGDVDAKKGVRFAQTLDVAPENERPAPPASERGEVLVEPLGDVVERSAPARANGAATEPKAPRRSSRFAKGRHETASSGEIPKGPLDVPARFADQEIRETRASGPEGTTVADRLVEREPRLNPLAPGKLEDSMDHDAVAAEYQALRNKFIQRRGGFLQEDESPDRVLDEAENTSEPVSRFRAARLSRQ